jgi:hypothetical protein
MKELNYLIRFVGYLVYRSICLDISKLYLILSFRTASLHICQHSLVQLILIYYTDGVPDAEVNGYNLSLYQRFLVRLLRALSSVVLELYFIIVDFFF